MATDRSRANHSAETFARSAATAVGAVFLLVGILGFVPGVTTDYDTLAFADHHSEAELLGLFQVSVLHNIVHLLFGVAGLAAGRQVRHVVPYLLGGAAVYLVLTIYGIVIDKDSSANFVPVNSADNWLHLGLAAGMAVLGLLVKRRLETTGRPTNA
ncbi:MAG: hypothetical protein JWP31_2526 [Aeromicrobium sp.]|nr:hypothetical protein [Aeromicrobium sp.]